ncbi:hypothetical protein [Bellilinea sp.]|jgi:hypothetical protein|uniref:DUF2069 domain-containing protein n=1 Tax=Bellilinea caldifistulae TaxID=360411 RepID=A0A7C4KZY1_9CHLR|nr:hypothetical protein [Bellilinea sp.]
MKKRAGIDWLGGLIILLTAATAGIHISLLFPDVVFILNGLGFLSLAAAYFLPIPLFVQRRKWVAWAYVGYTLVTILLWVAIGERSTLGYLTKAIEIALLISVWLDYRRR